MGLLFCVNCHNLIYLFIDCIEKSGQGCGRVDNKAVFWYNIDVNVVKN